MKKNVFVIVLVTLTCFCVLSQEKLTYSEVIELPGKSKDQLYDQAKQWFIETYKDASEVIQNDDKAGGTIMGKALLSYNSNIYVGSAGTKGVIRYTIQISFKDGKYKYELTNFIHEGATFDFGTITTDDECPYKIKGGTKNWNNKVWNDIKMQIDEYSRNFIGDLKEAMNIKEIDDNW